MLKAMRLYFKTVGAVAPPLASWQAARLFLTPLPRRSASRWPEELARDARHTPLSFQGQSINAWSWGSGPRVLLVHGWGGIAAHLAALVTPLVNLGFEVMAFDGPAHGASASKRTNLVQFSELILQIERESASPVQAIIGHSFGASAIIVALKRGLKPRRVVLISPFSSSDRNIESFSKMLHLSPRVTAATRQRLLQVFERDLHIWDLAALTKDFGQPALILHDELDRDVPFSESQAIQSCWPGARLVGTKGLGHHLIVRDKKVASEVAQFLQS